MIRPLQVLKARFAAAQGLPMEDRLFQHLSLAAAVLSLFLVIPINYLQDLPPVFNLIIFAFGLGSWALYQRSVAGHPHKKTFALAVAVVLNLSWFTDGGSQGSIGMFFYTGVMIIAIFFRRRLRWAMLTAFTLNILLLLSLGHAWPGRHRGGQSGDQRTGRGKNTGLRHVRNVQKGQKRVPKPKRKICV